MSVENTGYRIVFVEDLSLSRVSPFSLFPFPVPFGSHVPVVGVGRIFNHQSQSQHPQQSG
jgi:hypothetical protein